MITGLIKLHHAFHFEPLIRIDEDRTPCRFSITKVLYKSTLRFLNDFTLIRPGLEIVSIIVDDIRHGRPSVDVCVFHHSLNENRFM